MRVATRGCRNTTHQRRDATEQNDQGVGARHDAVGHRRDAYLQRQDRAVGFSQVSVAPDTSFRARRAITTRAAASRCPRRITYALSTYFFAGSAGAADVAGAPGVASAPGAAGDLVSA